LALRALVSASGPSFILDILRVREEASVISQDLVDGDEEAADSQFP
jgi:hypothetical protein